MEGDGSTGFSPTFSHLEDICMQALHQCVSAAASIPRIGNTSTKGNPIYKQSHTPIIAANAHTVNAADPTKELPKPASKALSSPNKS